MLLLKLYEGGGEVSRAPYPASLLPSRLLDAYTKCPQSGIFIYSVGSPCAYRCDKIMMSFMATTDSAEQVLVYQP